MRIHMSTATLAFATLLAGSAHAADAPISVSHAWLRATPRTAPVAGGYVTLTNTGKAPDTLVSASLPMAPEGQVHTMTMKNGVMSMRRLDGLAIAPGATVTLRPGGDHLMFLNPKSQLKDGESVQGSLTFKHAGTVPVTFSVSGMAAETAPGTKIAPGSKGGASMHPGNGMEGPEMKGMY